MSALEFASLVDEAGFPPGVFNVVCGAAETGQALTMHPLVDKISFTGERRRWLADSEAAAKPEGAAPRPNRGPLP